MCSIDDFLNNIVPDILRDIPSKIQFAVIGSRAINMYLSMVLNSQLLTGDWDIAIESASPDSSARIGNMFANLLTRRGYVATVHNYKGTGNDNSYYSFRSRPWTRVTVTVCDAEIVALDVYQVPELIGLGQFREVNGLLYSDLGFLVRELNKAESDIAEQIKKYHSLSDADITNILKNIQIELNNSRDALEEIQAESDELIEGFGQLSDREIKETAEEQKTNLQKVVNKLKYILISREKLFRALISGNLDKSLINPVCDVCREYEEQYMLYYGLKTQCTDFTRLCQS